MLVEFLRTFSNFDRNFKKCFFFKISTPFLKLGDSDCCFVEVRYSNQNLQQLCTGCKDATACNDIKSQNFEGTPMTSEQCRPELGQAHNKRNGKIQSVCRQCFNTCDASHGEGRVEK